MSFQPEIAALNLSALTATTIHSRQHPLPPTPVNTPNIPHHDRIIAEHGHSISITKATLRNFHSRFQYLPPRIGPDVALREKVSAEISAWNVGLSPRFIAGLTDTSCSIAESAYSHTSPAHQYIVAIYTACMVYADDLGERHLDLIERFGERFASREDQGNPVLNRLVELLGMMHRYYARLSADAIIANSLEFLSGCVMEVRSKGMRVSPTATRYPYYLRLKTGVGAAYTNFNFDKQWDSKMATFLQLIPEMDFLTVGINDLLSYYKEILDGETDNYIHLRASADETTPILALQQLSDDLIQTSEKVKRLSSYDVKLASILRSYLMGYIEFHHKAGRYRLADIMVE